MTDDAAPRELMAAYEAALDIAQRSLSMARALGEGARVGMLPPEVTLAAYLARMQHDEMRVAELRAHLQQVKSTGASTPR
jgi:hypothetical protein